MRFSIIIPVYNVAPYLRQCLDSVLAQTFGDWEAICVNDGSTDGSAAILEEYVVKDSRFKVITQTNGGLSAARNAGLKEVQGDYVLFLDSDDWIESNTLETINNNLIGEDMVCFGCCRTDSEQIDNPSPERLSGWDYYNRHALEFRIVPFVCVVQRCYRRQMLEDRQLQFREGILHEDNYFTPQVCMAAKTVKVISDALYTYRIREGSIMTTRSICSRKSMILVANELPALISGRSDVSYDVFFRAMAQHYQMAFTDASREEDRQLLPLVDWRCYHIVSRTRMRHRINYIALRISPRCFRFINGLL